MMDIEWPPAEELSPVHQEAAPPKARGIEFVRDWWSDRVLEDCHAVCVKLEHYGSLDLHARATLELMGRPGDSLRNGTEAVIAHYLAGKLSRILSALSRGILPTEDSWDDFARYAMMARYVRQFGSWP